MTDPLSSQQEDNGVEKLQLLPDKALLSSASVQTFNEKTCCDSSDTAGTNTSKTVKLNVGKKDSVTMLTTVNRTTACSLFHK